MPTKLTTLSQRRLLFIASGLVLIMGIILYFLATQTETFFAWTVGIPLTAAFLGGGYLASFALEFMSAREEEWSNSRVAVPAVLMFTALTFVTTMIHLDKFHFNESNIITVGVTWVWTLVYASVPITMSIILLQQMRAAGDIPDHVNPLPSWFKGSLGLQGAFMFLFGLGLFLWPTTFGDYWPWKQTALTAQAIGAWGIGIGIVALHSAWENEWRRIYAAMIAYALYGVLQVINLIRFPDAKGMDWSEANMIFYVMFILSLAIVGTYGAWQSQQYTSE